MTEAAIKDLPALAPAERAAVVLQSAKAAAELTALVESSQSITAITNADGRTECHAAAMKAKAARVAIEKAGREARDDANAFSRAVIVEANRLVDIIEPEQDRLLALRDGWDAKIEAEKAAKIEAERLRVAEIMARIDELRDIALGAVGKNATWLSMTMNTLAGWVIDDTFAEFATEAEGVKRATLAKLDTMRVAAELAEAEAARVAEEKRIADLMAAQELADREAEAIRQREENERLRIANEAEQVRLKAEADRLRAENEAAAAKLKAEREAFEKLQRDAEEQQRQKDAAEAKAKAEAEAAEKSRLDAIGNPFIVETGVHIGAGAAAEDVAVPAVSFDAMMAATIAPVLGDPKSRRNVIIDEIDGALAVMSMDELEQVAHFIDRLQSLRKAA